MSFIIYSRNLELFGLLGLRGLSWIDCPAIYAVTMAVLQMDSVLYRRLYLHKLAFKSQ